jgi:hypothetical protein
VNPHATGVTLRLLILALGVGAIILLPSLAFLFHIFKGRESLGGGINHETA